MTTHAWLVSLVAAVLIHGVLFWAYLPSLVTQSGAAKGRGEQGMEIGLGAAGSYIAALQSSNRAASAKPEPAQSPKSRESEMHASTAKNNAPEVTENPIAEKVDLPANTGLSAQYTSDVADLRPIKEEVVINAKAEHGNSNDNRNLKSIAEEKNAAARDGTDRQATLRATGSAAARFAGGEIGSARDYFSVLTAWLNKHKRYPISAKKQKLQGVVKLQFSIARDGSVSGVRLYESSGSAALDSAAIQMLDAAAPMPPLPETMRRDALNIVIPVEFSLITNTSFMEKK